jgi:hypothetical protein
LALRTIEPYAALVAKAAKDQIQLMLNSGFRSYSEQKYLYDGFVRGLPGFNTAAKPGFSKHQNGIAFDISVPGGNGNSTYEWLKQYATAFGFVRTVSKEPWHWEFDEAKARDALAAGTFKTPDVMAWTVCTRLIVSPEFVYRTGVNDMGFPDHFQRKFSASIWRAPAASWLNQRATIPNVASRPVIIASSALGVNMLWFCPNPINISNIDFHYEDYVIGGPGSFAGTIKIREKFKQAIRTKLLLKDTPGHQMVPAAAREKSSVRKSGRSAGDDTSTRCVSVAAGGRSRISFACTFSLYFLIQRSRNSAFFALKASRYT